MEQTDPSHAGQAFYTKRTLRAYDAIVVRLSNSLVWHPPAGFGPTTSDTSVPRTSTSDRGRDYLDHVRFPVEAPSITLLDPNPEVLRYAAHRLRRYAPMVHAADALKPITLEPRSFRSAALSYVLHCLPGQLSDKAVVLDNIAPLIEPGGVIFGTTILTMASTTPDWPRWCVLYNHGGIFSNLEDDLGSLRRELGRRFDHHELEVLSSSAVRRRVA